METTVTALGPDPVRGERWGGHDVPNRWHIDLDDGALEFDYWTGSGITEPATAAHALASYLFDVSTVAAGETFDEWADELGEDTDSRRAEASYNACVKYRDDLCDWLGWSLEDLADRIAAAHDADDHDFDGLAEAIIRGDR